MQANLKRHLFAPHKDKHAFSDRKQRMYDFLTANPIGVLSTVTPDGEPHGVVVYFTIDKQFKVSFLTRAETRKYDNLKHNNHVMLTVFEPRNQAVVQLTGKATELTSSLAINAVAGCIAGISKRSSDAGLPPIVKLKAGEFVAFRIDPVLVRMAVYARPGPGEYQDLFESVESFDLELV